MKGIFKIAVYSLFVLLSACDSEEAFDCVKKPGDIETKVITEFPEFNDLVIHDDISLQIIEDESEYFELTYGKNLISKINFKLENDSLLLTNDNFCSWARDYQKPLLKWHTNKESIYINSQTTGEIFNTDTLRKNLQIHTREISNEIELFVSNNATVLSSSSISNFHISGNSNSMKIFSYFSDSRFELGNFEVNHISVLQRGFNDIIVHAKDSLIGSIENAGRVLYYGNPGVKMVVQNGGKLIKLEE
ncbi:DUF2807 domain-containing protein [Marivirga sp. S37H4]|uniref:DUF2807 domain-containing protein n=1 Tax=Marivirga aurantiaca TaxID=2802615 RepID=A0A935C5F4_9BACT|nr:DUF2807 domain-containing protein [Marivirga aurantiaca]MBK6263784.1 DUF2807 domain-containing protein [Marivirga aurantiaca]